MKVHSEQSNVFCTKHWVSFEKGFDNQTQQRWRTPCGVDFSNVVGIRTTHPPQAESTGPFIGPDKDETCLCSFVGCEIRAHNVIMSSEKDSQVHASCPEKPKSHDIDKSCIEEGRSSSHSVDLPESGQHEVLGLRA